MVYIEFSQKDVIVFYLTFPVITCEIRLGLILRVLYKHKILV